MATFMQSDIFFFISSAGFVILFILVAVLVLYATRAFRTWGRILDKVEKNVDHIGETAHDMLGDVRDSTVYRLLVGKKKKKK